MYDLSVDAKRKELSFTTSFFSTRSGFWTGSDPFRVLRNNCNWFFCWLASVDSTLGQILVHTKACTYDDKVISFYLENPEKYKIISSYEATNIGELSLIEGHLVTIIEKNERGEYVWFLVRVFKETIVFSAKALTNVELAFCSIKCCMLPTTFL